MERTIDEIEQAFYSVAIGPEQFDRGLVCGFVRALGLEVSSRDYLLCLVHLAAAVVLIREVQSGRYVASPEILGRIDSLLK
jgi:hypothetical protein